ncbi:MULTISPECIES: hypothetical protein [unclassified Chelatococcus]|uniref:hypothetical protein n=1 Tax=unclassified Chelatococcus TaxID=2638111 RepID=UPI001BCE0A97|nr:MULTISPECIES: hypothetical protein [unclassified Chelatococcus]MBS7697002.1 hypothetical protein [Chelatococcus sp. YT9]MBX3555992.1 hypothetical protein [Chelatococcus sp.]
MEMDVTSGQRSWHVMQDRRVMQVPDFSLWRLTDTAARFGTGVSIAEASSSGCPIQTTGLTWHVSPLFWRALPMDHGRDRHRSRWTRPELADSDRESHFRMGSTRRKSSRRLLLYLLTKVPKIVIKRYKCAELSIKCRKSACKADAPDEKRH